MKAALNKKTLVIFLIIGLGFFLRLYQLPKNPAGLHGDEVSIGYNAFSLLKTAKDQDGNFLPLAIDQFGDFRPPGYHYLDIPFVYALGLNSLAVRLPSAIFGGLTLIVFYLFLKKMFNKESFALISTFLLAISPWHINISRATSESVIAAFFLITGLYLILLFRKNQQILTLLISFVSLFTSFLFYHHVRLFVPLFLPFFLFFLYRDNNAKNGKSFAIKAVTFYLLLTAALVILLFNSQGAGRPSGISIFNMPGAGTAGEITQQIGEDGNQPVLISRFFHNKLISHARIFAIFYSKHFSGEFLFVNNGNPIRYRIPWFGNMYPVEMIFLTFGLASMVVYGLKKSEKTFLVTLAWLFLAAVPAGLTWEDTPNVQRASLMIFALIPITAYGLLEIFNLIKKQSKTYWLLIPLLLAFYSHGLALFLHNYFHHALIHEPWYRSGATAEVVFQLQTLKQDHSKIIMTTQGNNNLIHYLFYTNYDPQKFQALGSPREKNELNFDGIVFSHLDCPLEGDPEQEIKGDYEIYVVKNQCRLPKNSLVLSTPVYSDGVPAYKVVKLLPPVNKKL